MKNLITICLLIAIAFTTNAQDGKPTKEQTVEYIKSYFNELKIEGWYQGNYYKYSNNYKITVNDSKVIIEWNHINFDNSFDRKKYEFDIKDIVQLGVSIDEGAGYCENGIYFYTLNNKPLIKKSEGSNETYENKFDVSIYRGSNCINDVSQTQIYKAFNHLRKLCGAPEPIKF